MRIKDIGTMYSVAKNASEEQSEYLTNFIATKLTGLFSSKSWTPKTVRQCYEYLEDYRRLTGTEYQIPIKENNIV